MPRWERERHFSPRPRTCPAQSPRLSTLIISVTEHYRLIENKLPCDQDIRYFIEISDRESLNAHFRAYHAYFFPIVYFLEDSQRKKFSNDDIHGLQNSILPRIRVFAYLRSIVDCHFVRLDSQDVDLDAILGELCALERRCDGDIAATPAQDSQRQGRPNNGRITATDNTDIGKNEGGKRCY